MKSQPFCLNTLALVCFSITNLAAAVEPYPGERAIVIKAPHLESLNGKPVRVIEHLETGAFKEITAPTLEEANANSRSLTAEDKANITTYKDPARELVARLKQLPKERYLISNYKHSNEHDYLLFFPKHYDKSKTYPVVLSLHGSGGSRVEDMLQLASNSVGPAAAVLDYAKRFPCFVVVPRAKRKELWGYWHSRAKLAGRDWRADWRMSNGDEVIGLLKDLETRYPIDPSRRYVTGQSMGGMGTFEMVINRQGIFAAAVPVVGVPYSGDAPKLDCPTWLFTAEFEGAAGQISSKVRCNFDFYKAARAEDKDVRLTMFCSYGHASHQLVFYYPGMWEWLFSQQRRDVEP